MNHTGDYVALTFEDATGVQGNTIFVNNPVIGTDAELLYCGDSKS